MFEAAIASPDQHRLFVAEAGADLVGYALTHVGPDALPSDLVRPGRVEEGSAYLSKCYVDRAWRGSGIADALIEHAVADAGAAGHGASFLQAAWIPQAVDPNIRRGWRTQLRRRHGA